MDLILLSFKEFLQQKYSPNTTREILKNLRRISELVGNPDQISPEEVRDFYWNGSKKVRNKAVTAIKRYKEFLRYQQEAGQRLNGFFDGKEECVGYGNNKND